MLWKKHGVEIIAFFFNFCQAQLQEFQILLFSVYRYSTQGFINPLTPRAFYQKHIFWTFGDFQTGYGPNYHQSTQKGICNMTARHTFYKCCLLQHFCAGMHRNQNFEVTCILELFIFFAFLFSFLIFLLQWLTHWTCFPFKIFWESIRDGQFLPWSSHLYWQKSLLRVFHPN